MASRICALGFLAGVALVSLLVTAPAPAVGLRAGAGAAGTVASSGGQAAPAPAPASPAPPAFAVGMRVERLLDPARPIRSAGGRTRPRTLLTYVRYPAVGTPGQTDVLDAAPAQGPFPLVVFAHGFAVTPGIYARLLQSWAAAGYVVVAPVFPLENANAPGGPDEADLVNEPDDMRFVISWMLTANSTPGDPLAGLLEGGSIAVAGQSDGGEAALATAYSRRFRDPRVSAAVILSGAEMSGVGGFAFSHGSPALLAAQGTADKINQPRFTSAFFAAARRPKYLLRLLGAGHLPPYTFQQPQLSIVEQVTIAFLDGYLKHRPGPAQRLAALGSVAGRAALLAAP